MIDKRKPGQSQLDYLWTNFGGLEISNESSSNPSDQIILTESAIIDLIKSQIGKTDLSLDTRVDNNTLILQIKDQQGTIISETSFDRGAIIIDFDKFISTQDDVDNGLVDRVGQQCIRLKDSIGQEFVIEFDMSGSETDTIITTVIQGKVASQIKIDNPITNKSVDLKATTNGIRAEIVIDETLDSAIVIEKGDNGISCHYKWIDESTEVRFKALTLGQYNVIKNPDQGTLYFITDHPCIYFRKIKYASPKNLDITEIEQMINNAKDDLKEYIDEQFIWYVES